MTEEMTDDDGIWISDEDNEILQQAKAAQEDIVVSQTPTTPPANAVDVQLSELRDAGDVTGYENAREAAMKAALDEDNHAEFNRIANEHRPPGMPQYVPPPAAPTPTAQDLANLQQIFDNPQYQEAMNGTDGSAEETGAVYDQFGVPNEARWKFPSKASNAAGAPDA